MRSWFALCTLLAALALPAAAAADEGPDAAWTDPCGDAAAYTEVNGQRQELPSRTDGRVDLRAVEVDGEDDAVTVRFDTCRAFRAGDGAQLALRAATADGCELTVSLGDVVDVGEIDNIAEYELMAHVRVNCDRSGPIWIGEASAEVPFSLDGERATITLPRAELPDRLAEDLAPGAVLHGPKADGVEHLAVLVGSATVGPVQHHETRTSAIDFAPGPERIVLG